MKKQNGKLQEENIKLGSELYNAHREHEDVLNNLKSKLQSTVLQDRNDSSVNVLNAMVEQAVLEKKGYQDFFDSRPMRSGWFMMVTELAKPSLFSSSSSGKKSKRWFELRGDTLCWFRGRDAQEKLGSVCLKEYTVSMVQKDTDAFEDEEHETKRRRSSGLKSAEAKKQLCIELTPVQHQAYTITETLTASVSEIAAYAGFSLSGKVNVFQYLLKTCSNF